MSLCKMHTDRTIAQTYAGKNVFITGGSGFIGKALTEKLLRTFKDLGNIYWLTRPKKGLSFEERLQNVFKDPLFNLIKRENPDAYKKIKFVSGDIKEINLGLSETDYEEIINEVSIVFHVAATIKFHEHLTDSILLNVRGTREVSNLVLKLKNITCFVHVSTSYCMHQHKIVEEKTYHVNTNWQEAIAIAEKIDRNTLNSLTYKYIGYNPNTYTFTKGLAEKVVEELCGDKVPSVIIRPAIVVAAYNDPFCGWADNLNGPIGLSIAVIKGVARSYLYVKNGKSDLIPVDLVIKGMISSVWKQRNSKEIQVYNGVFKPIKQNYYFDLIKKHYHQLRIPKAVYPESIQPPYYFWILLFFYCFQLLPAAVLDMYAHLVGKRPMMLRLQRKIMKLYITLWYFVKNQWEFKNKKFLHLLKHVPAEDSEDLGVKVLSVIDSAEDLMDYIYFKESIHYAYENVLKLKLLDKPRSKQKIKMMRLYNLIVVLGILGLIGYILYWIFWT